MSPAPKPKLTADQQQLLNSALKNIYVPEEEWQNSLAGGLSATTSGSGVLNLDNLHNNNIYPGSKALGGFILNTNTISSGSTSTLTPYVKDMRTDLQDLCINVEKYDQLDTTLRTLADEFFAAVAQSTMLNGKNVMIFNTLLVYEVLRNKDAHERIRKLTALTDEKD